MFVFLSALQCAAVAPDGLAPLRFQLEGWQIISVAKGGCAD